MTPANQPDLASADPATGNRVTPAKTVTGGQVAASDSGAGSQVAPAQAAAGSEVMPTDAGAGSRGAPAGAVNGGRVTATDGLDVHVDEPALAVPPAMRSAMFSVVIPVFNSADVVGATIDRTVAFFDAHDLAFEIICVNDGSRDDSWRVLERKAAEHRQVVPINLLRNYGQHNANLCGFRHARGDWVVTIDDDLQNPPEEILKLLVAADADDRDVVFGEFARKQAARHRRLGSQLIGVINRRVFRQPRDLVVSNFRLLRRDVVDRICADRSAFPYITGLALLYSHNRGNTLVEHAPRASGHSNYNLLRITRLVLTILFSYSAFPLRLSAAIGAVVAALAFLIGGVYFVAGMTGAIRVQGWTSLVVLLSFFNGVTILMLSMLGEYIVRTLNQTSSREPYHVVEIIRPEEGAGGERDPNGPATG